MKQRFEVEFKEMTGYSMIELTNYNDDSTSNKIRLFPNEMLKALKIINSSLRTFEEPVLNKKHSHAYQLINF
jgi:hypothetical protein